MLSKASLRHLEGLAFGYVEQTPRTGEPAEPTIMALISNKRFEEAIVIHPLDPSDATIVAAMREIVRPVKGLQRGIQEREAFDALMERVQPREDVAFEPDTLGGVSGIWIHPVHRAGPECVILHLHGGWFSFGNARAYQNFVSHIAAKARASTFVPNYRLAPEHPFPAAVEDVLACYDALAERGVQRAAITGDSAGGNLALVLATRASNEAGSSRVTIVAVVGLSPVTDLTLSGRSYETRADADAYFTRPQVQELVRSYLKEAAPEQPEASPLYARLSGMPPIRIHAGDDEVLLDDSKRFVERAVLARTDARLDVWMGMPHGFVASIGKLKASAQALDAVGTFLANALQTRGSPSF